MPRPRQHFPLLAELVAVGRQDLGLSIREMSALSGVSNPTISQIERGFYSDPQLSTIVGLARALGLRPASLVELVTEPSSPELRAGEA